MPEFDDINEALRALSRQMAVIRGESAAARLLAAQALDLAVWPTPDPEAILKKLEENVEAVINQLYGTGATESEALDAVAREAARAKCYEILDSLRSRHRSRG